MAEVLLPLLLAPNVAAPKFMQNATIVGIIGIGDNNAGDTIIKRNGVAFVTLPAPANPGIASYGLTGLQLKLLEGDVLIQSNANAANVQLIFA